MARTGRRSHKPGGEGTEIVKRPSRTLRQPDVHGHKPSRGNDSPPSVLDPGSESFKTFPTPLDLKNPVEHGKQSPTLVALARKKFRLEITHMRLTSEEASDKQQIDDLRKENEQLRRNYAASLYEQRVKAHYLEKEYVNMLKARDEMLRKLNNSSALQILEELDPSPLGWEDSTLQWLAEDEFLAWVLSGEDYPGVLCRGNNAWEGALHA